jgi:molybdopterin converting factor small subunit
MGWQTWGAWENNSGQGNGNGQQIVAKKLDTASDDSHSIWTGAGNLLAVMFRTAENNSESPICPGGGSGRRVRRRPSLSGCTLQTMTITIRIPAALRIYCTGDSELSLSAASVRAALEHLEQSHPSLYHSVCDETGSVRRHVNVFVNTAHVRDRDGLETALIPGDVVTILPAVSGG